MKEKEVDVANRVKHKITINNSVETLYNAAYEYSNWFWVEHSHNFSLANQKMCAQRTIDILNLDVNTAAQIQHTVIRAYTIADDMLKVNEAIQGVHLIASQNIQGHLASKLNTYTPPPPPDTSPLANITENTVELRNVPNAVNTLIQHTIQQNGAGKGVDAIKNVQNFNLSYDLIQDNDAAALNDGLYGYTIKTQTFNLGNNSIGATGIDHLVKGSIGMGYALNGGKDINQTMQGIFTLSTTSIVHLNLCNNNIGDVGAGIICHALVNGKMKNTKTIDVSENNITKIGEGYFTQSIKQAPNKDFMATFDMKKATMEVSKTGKHAMSSGIKTSLKEFIDHAKSQGVDTTHVATNKSTWEYMKDGVKIGGNLGMGILKCSNALIEVLFLDTTAPSTAKNIAVEMYGNKTVKKADIRLCLVLEAYDAIVSPEGLDLAVKTADLLGDNE